MFIFMRLLRKHPICSILIIVLAFSGPFWKKINTGIIYQLTLVDAFWELNNIRKNYKGIVENYSKS